MSQLGSFTHSGARRDLSMPFGTAYGTGGVTFRLWAPTARTVDLCLRAGGVESVLPMSPYSTGQKPADSHLPGNNTGTSEGWYHITVAEAVAGDLYQFCIDGDLKVPDPASRYQPQDVHGPSEIIDPRTFAWSDIKWRGLAWEESIVYELHVGTFTPEGTFGAAAERLPYLRDLGITAIELMPVSDFPGKRNWGYDGVLPYAPDSSYGRPEDLKRFVDKAHALGMMVFLDVVYNHFGPEGNYLYVYARPFFTDKHKTPWGSAINFDDDHNEVVRSYFIHNALYWLTEYNMDGLRFDAVHAIYDSSERHFLEQLAEDVRRRVPVGRQVHLILENADNKSSLLTRTGSGQLNHFTAQWNDDFHHCLHVLSTGEREGYYSDYVAETSFASTLDHLARVLTSGFAYQGDPSQHQKGEIRGEDSRALPLTAFVSFIQNHDQVGNRAFGERLAALVNPDAYRACLSVLLLSPQIPMLFMGDEWASKTPFFFFCDLGADLAPKVTAGRRAEFASFPQFADPKNREKIPDPCSEKTFEQSKLNWDGEHQVWYQYVSQLLRLRKSVIVPQLTSGCRSVDCTFEKIGTNILHVRWTFGDGSQLRMLGNFEERACELSPPIEPDCELIHDTAGGAAQHAGGGENVQAPITAEVSAAMKKRTTGADPKPITSLRGWQIKWFFNPGENVRKPSN